MIESFYCNTEDVEIRFFDTNGEIYKRYSGGTNPGVGCLRVLELLAEIIYNKGKSHLRKSTEQNNQNNV